MKDKKYFFKTLTTVVFLITMGEIHAGTAHILKAANALKNPAAEMILHRLLGIPTARLAGMDIPQREELLTRELDALADRELATNIKDVFGRISRGHPEVEKEIAELLPRIPIKTISVRKFLNKNTEAPPLKTGTVRIDMRLHQAVTEEDFHTTSQLLSIGVDINIQDKMGNTPLKDAFHQNRNSMARFLLEEGADPDIPDGHGNTPLMSAVKINNEEGIQLLIGTGSDLNIQNQRGSTALNLAAYKQNNKLLEMLLAAGADPNIPDRFGNTPLFLTIRDNNQDGLQLLIGAGSDLNIQNQDSLTPLASAAHLQNNEILDILLAAGADPNIQSKYGNIPIFIALNKNNREGFRLLIEAGSDLNIRDKEYGLMTPLQLAAHKKTMQYWRC